MGLLLANHPSLAANDLADAAMTRDMGRVDALLNGGADVNAPGQYGTPPLHWLVRAQELDAAKRLIEAGGDVNQAAPLAVYPLHLAIANSDAAMVGLLLAHQAHPNQRDRTGETPLMMAVPGGNLQIVRSLVAAGGGIDERDPAYGQTALMIAARTGQAEIAKYLVTAGADVDAQGKAGPVPRFRLPSGNKGSKGVGIVRGGWPERGMRPPVPGARTPLLYAAREGHADIACLLVEHDADLEKADANGVTPLLTAIINNHADTARLLISLGADVTAVDWYGQTPLFAAVDIRNVDVRSTGADNGIDREAWLDIVRLLLKKGADPNSRTAEFPPERRFITGLGSLSWVDFTGQTPFLRAALAGDVTLMRLLADHGADPTIPTFGGTTPLMAAAGVNWVVNQTFDEGAEHLLEAVRLAHELGNDINAVNSMGLQAIHGAANRGSDEIIRYLAQNGAEVDAPDVQGRTPLTWARGVFLATHPPVNRTGTSALIEQLMAEKP